MSCLDAPKKAFFQETPLFCLDIYIQYIPNCFYILINVSIVRDLITEKWIFDEYVIFSYF